MRVMERSVVQLPGSDTVWWFTVAEKRALGWMSRSAGFGGYCCAALPCWGWGCS
jgi:hypothetical protein